MEGYLPFGSNLIRCVAGLVCFSAWLMVMNWRRPVEQRQSLRASLSDRKGFLAMLVLVVSGPFLGVGFSLMAVQYTAAGIASTLMATTPIIILLPSWWLFGQRITLRNVLGAVISVVGVSLFFV
jgi:drug/metabolite transporter (DMT)-like permease